MKDKQKKIKVYFLGSGKIGVPIVQRLIDSELIDLIGIGTQQDQPSGRKMKLHPTPIGSWTEKNGYTVDKPSSVNSLEFLKKLEKLTPDVILVVSYGQMLKKEILSLPKYGCINVHASLLPQYRGASPVVASILNGDNVTGIAIMKMGKGLDSGPLLTSFLHQLTGSETAEKLERHLSNLAAENIEKVFEGICSGKLIPQVQDTSRASYVTKVKKQDGKIDWFFTAEKIEKMVRAYYPWPGAYFFLDIDSKKKKIQITEAVVVQNTTVEKPGKILKHDKKRLIIACDDEALEIKKLILEGKKEMTGADFLMGYGKRVGKS